jgi:hypothetical protein
MRSRWSTMVIAVVTAAALATSAQAGQIISSPSTTGASYSGTLEVVPDPNTSSTSATLEITLENTTDPSVGGALTSFAFNLPIGATASSIDAFTAVGTGNDADWTAFLDPTSGSVTFDIGAGTGSDLEGGTVASGVQVGATATFTIEFTGTGLLNLTQSGFHDFFGRFQGLEPNDQSDKVPGIIVPPLTAVPEPASIGMALSGAIPLGLWVVRRRKRATA